jgi:putative thioredoxin
MHTQSTPSSYIFDADDSTFNDLVVQQSLTTPVLVDCWAEWCGPCKSLTPTLERLTQSYKGRFNLVKVNIDEAPQVAMALRVQSVPFMILFIEGRPVDALVGNQTEADLKAFLDKHLPIEENNPLDLALEAFQNGDLDQAASYYESVLRQDPHQSEAHLGRARVALSQGDLETASLHLNAIGEHDPLFEKANTLKGVFQFAEHAGNERGLLTEIEKTPTDVSLWYQLGATYAIQGDFEAACHGFLKVVSLDREYQDDAGRKALLTLFDILGEQGSVVMTYRRRLASLLF